MTALPGAACNIPFCWGCVANTAGKSNKEQKGSHTGTMPLCYSGPNLTGAAVLVFIE